MAGYTYETSKVKGVFWNKKRKKWVTQPTLGGKKRSLGSFPTEAEAVAAVEAAREAKQEGMLQEHLAELKRRPKVSCVHRSLFGSMEFLVR